MAMMLGIRVAGYAVVAATAIITHDSTKLTTEKLYKWAKDKFTRHSHPDTDTDVVHHSNDDDAPQPFPSHAQHTNDRQQTPPHSVHVAVSPDDLTVDAPQVDDNKLSRAASDAASATPEEEQPKPPHSLLARAADNAVHQDNLTALAPHADDNQLTILAVESEADGSDGALDAVKDGQPAEPEVTLSRGAPVGSDNPPGESPDPAPAAGIVGSVRAAVAAAAVWARRLFHWAAGHHESAGPEATLSRRAPDLPPAVEIDRGAPCADSGGIEAPVDPDNPPREPPDPAPATGILGSVRAEVGAATAWARGLFHWAAGQHESAGPDTPGLAKRILEPKTLNKIGRILKKIAWLGVNIYVDDVLKRNRVWREIYRIVKNELF